jgi:hypothetical protein
LLAAISFWCSATLSRAHLGIVAAHPGLLTCQLQRLGPAMDRNVAHDTAYRAVEPKPFGTRVIWREIDLARDCDSGRRFKFWCVWDLLSNKQPCTSYSSFKLSHHTMHLFILIIMRYMIMSYTMRYPTVPYHTLTRHRHRGLFMTRRLFTGAV